jgi:hypothetical protein
MAPAARVLVLLIWLLAAAAGLAGVVLSILDGAVLRTMAAVLLLSTLIPTGRWLASRPAPLVLAWSRQQGWAAHDLGPIERPQAVLDAGSWICLRLTPRGDPSRWGGGSRAPLRWHLVQPDSSASDAVRAAAWVALRQRLGLGSGAGAAQRSAP